MNENLSYVRAVGIIQRRKERRMNKMVYVIQDREAGNVIDWVDTYEEAEAELAKYERQDKEDGIYQEDFYEIVKTKRGGTNGK